MEVRGPARPTSEVTRDLSLLRDLKRLGQSAWMAGSGLAPLASSCKMRTCLGLYGRQRQDVLREPVRCQDRTDAFASTDWSELDRMARSRSGPKPARSV
jgi:hypothetical protein